MPRSLPPQGAGLKSNHADLMLDAFPESAREIVRQRVLKDGEILVLRYGPTESKGATRDAWSPDDNPIRGRLDPAGGSSGIKAAIVHEDTTHVASVDAGAGVNPQDRIHAHGTDWIILGVQEPTDPAFDRFEVKRA